jgi:hypothetical protein
LRVDNRTILFGHDPAESRYDEIGRAGAALKTLDIGRMVPAEYDYVALSYTGADLTGVVFRTGGAGGTIVATLTLAYTAGNLTSVTKT